MSRIKRVFPSLLLALVMLAPFTPVLPASAASGLPTCPSITGSSLPTGGCEFEGHGLMQGIIAYQASTMSADGAYGTLPPLTISVPAGVASLLVQSLVDTQPSSSTKFVFTSVIGPGKPDQGASYTIPGTASGSAFVSDTVAAAVVLDHASSHPVTVPVTIQSAAGTQTVNLAIPGYMTASSNWHIYAQQGPLLTEKSGTTAPMAETWTATAPVLHDGAGYVSTLSLPAGTDYANVDYRIPAGQQVTVTQEFTETPTATAFLSNGVGLPFQPGASDFIPPTAPKVATKAPASAPAKAPAKAPALKIVGPTTVQTGVLTQYHVSPSIPVTWTTSLPFVGVSQDGILYSQDPSTVILTATGKDGAKASMTITALPLVLSIQGPATLTPGKTATYTIHGVPSGMLVTWTALFGGVFHEAWGSNVTFTPTAGNGKVYLQANVRDGQSVSRIITVSAPFPWWIVGLLLALIALAIALLVRNRRRAQQPPAPPATEEVAS